VKEEKESKGGREILYKDKGEKDKGEKDKVEKDKVEKD